MDFGKLPNVDAVRFDMPPEDSRTAAVLGGARARAPQVYVGGPVWACPLWVGSVYPPRTPARDYLKFYSQQFNAIELNATFYRIPARAQVEAWRSVVPADFKFTPKLHQGISHLGSVAAARAKLRDFFENVSHFGENLGLCFLQLPQHFAFESWGVLRQLLMVTPDPRRLAVEFRHSSWFVGGVVRPEVFEFLQSKGVTMVITDVSGRRDVLHSSLTSRRTFVRFTGNELHPSDYTRLDAWVERVASWIDRGMEEIYFFIHQPTELEVPDLARIFVDALNARCGLSVRTWKPLEAPKPPQMSLW